MCRLEDIYLGGLKDAQWLFGHSYRRQDGFALMIQLGRAPTTYIQLAGAGSKMGTM